VLEGDKTMITKQMEQALTQRVYGEMAVEGDVWAKKSPEQADSVWCWLAINRVNHTLDSIIVAHLGREVKGE
jgi:hypothetical protein